MSKITLRAWQQKSCLSFEICRQGVAVTQKSTVFGRTESANENAATEISAETVMGFPKHPNATNRELITNHYDFVKWAKKKYSNDEVYGRLEEFCDWLYSPEGKQIEQEYLSGVAGNEIEQANERFTYGKHEGRTFKEIAENDPSYHTRYIHMLRKKNEEPTGQLARYIEWFNKAKKSVYSRG
jgi:ABC-type phosphate transport system substrate-binding protein